jgi:pilus assembly protein Flp/PilA
VRKRIGERSLTVVLSPPQRAEVRNQEIHLSMNLITFLQSFIATRRQDEKGAAMVEYGLLVAGIAVVVGVAVAALGGRITDLFDGITF